MAQQILRNRINKSKNNFKLRVELKPSTIHGLGVFAIEDIPFMTKVCLYDGEDVPIIDTDKCNDIYNMPHPIKKGYVRRGYSVQQIKQDYGIGQFINDFCKPDINLDNKYTITHLQNLEANYYKKSKEHCNVAFVDDDFWLYST